MEIEDGLDFIEDSGKFLKKNWKWLLILVFMTLLGITAIFNQAGNEVAKAGDEAVEEIVNAGVETGKGLSYELTKDLKDPALKSIIVILIWFIVIAIFSSIVIVLIGKFAEIGKALNPSNIAKSIARR